MRRTMTSFARALLQLAIVVCLLRTTTVLGATVPSPPQNLACQSGPSSGSTVLSFDPSASSGGENILFYTVRYSQGSSAQSTNYSSISPVQITNLIPGVTYAFQVAAVNVVGGSSYSNTVSCVAGAAPSIPLAPSVTYNATTTTTTFRWVPPATFGGMKVLNYQLFVFTSTGSLIKNEIVASAPAVAFTDIPVGSYTLLLNAFSSIGSSANTTAVSFTTSATPAVPSSPRNPVWKAFNNGIQVRFDPPAFDGGSPLLQYTLRANGVTISTGTSSPLQVTGLSNTAPNPAMELWATNAVGSSVSVTTSAVLPGTSFVPPAAPTNLQVTLSTGSSVSVDWTHVDDGTSKIAYFVVYYGDRDVTQTAISSFTVTTTSKPIIVEGLCKGTFTFFVEAVGTASDYNSLTSPASTAVVYSSVGLKPSVATSVQALPSTNGVSVFFLPPTSGSLILTYSLQYTVSSLPKTYFGASPITATDGLVNGATTTFYLTAISCAGPGSAYEFTATPNTLISVPAPGSVTILSITPGNTILTLNFTVNSAAANNYVSFYLINTLTIQGYMTYDSTQSVNSITLTGLTNGVQYGLYAIARSTGGPSPDSNQVTGQPFGPVGPVQNLTCISGPAAASITCSWNAPSDTGGLTLQDYSVRWSTGGSSNSGSQSPSSGLTYKVLTSLTAGATYTVDVIANTLMATSVATTVVVRAAIVPSQPSLSCTDVSGAITITYGPPSDLGGQYLKYYLLTDTASGVTSAAMNLTASSTTRTFTGLNNGEQHDYSLRAYNDAGGSAAAAISCTAATIPGCPTLFQAVSGPTAVGQATANWSYVPTNLNGGAVVTGYTLSWTGSDGSVGTPKVLSGINTLQWTESSLTPNLIYTFTVVATNRKGSSIGCNSTTAQAAGVPDKPVIVKIIPSDGALTVVVVPNNSNNTGGIRLSQYECTFVNGGTSIVAQKQYGDTTPFTQTGLTNGQTYTITCVVYNAINAKSAASDPASGIPAAIPNPTTNVVLQSGPTLGQINATWLAPTFNGGSALTGFTIVWRNPLNAANTGIVNINSATTFSAIISGLNPNVTYNVTVLAVNLVGPSVVGPTSSALGLAASPPCPPINVVAVAGNGSIAVTFDPSTCTGGLALGNYFVTIRNNVTNARAAYAIVPGGVGMTITVNKLTNGIWYAVEVTASNAAGNSTIVPSPTLYARPATLPQPPTITSVNSGNTFVSLIITPPADNGGSNIVQYTCYYNISTVSPSSYLGSPLVFTTAPYLVNGLTNGQNYSFSCMGRNAVGNSSLSNVAYGVPANVPDPPTDVSPISGGLSGQITIPLWTAPAWNGGLPITGYNVTASDSSNHRSTALVSASTHSYTFSNLIPNITYLVSVQAINVMGPSPVILGAGYSNAGYALAADVPCPPQSVSYLRDASSVTATWTYPACNGGMNITNYYVYIRVTQANGTAVSNAPTAVYPVTASSFTTTITGLNNGWVYAASMTAANVIGNSTRTPEFQFVPATVPSAPTSFSCASGPSSAGSITVKWQQPANLGGLLTVSSYNFTYTSLSTGDVMTQTCTGVFQCTNLILAPRLNYSITAVAINDIGVGQATSPIFCTAAAPPDQINPVTCLGTDQTITLSFPTPYSNLAIQRYAINYTIASTSQIKNYSPVATPTQSLQLTGVANENVYSIFVFACNSAGCSVPSTSFLCAAGTPPNVPTSPVATPYNNDVVLTYGPPAAPTGSPVSLYKAYMIETGVLLTSTGFSIDFPNLQSETTYTIQLWASNDFGVSANRTITVTTLNLLPPDNMQAFQPASAATPTCVVYFTPAPQKPNSPSVATQFLVEYRLFGSNNAWGSQVSTTIPVSIANLGAASSYSMRVTAQNSYASSVVTVEFLCVTGQTNYATQPTAPFIVAGPGNNQSVVAIRSPVSTGGTNLLNYYVYTSGKGGNGAVPTPHVSVTANSEVSFGTAANLVNGYVYYHYVTANNAQGQPQYIPVSEPSGLVSTLPQAAYMPPSAIAANTVTAQPDDKKVTFTITSVPSSNTALLGYLVQWPVTTANTPVAIGASSMSNSTTTIVATGNLNNGQPTLFQVQAINGAGYSTIYYTPSIIPGVLPGPPTNVVGSPRDSGADVYFSPPLNPGSNTVTQYNVYYRDRPVTASPTTGISSPITVTGLTNGVVSNLTICSVSAVSPPDAPLWQAGVAPSSCTSFMVIANPVPFPNLNGSLIFIQPVPALPNSGVRGLDNLCLGGMRLSHALVCDSTTGRSFANSFWYRPTDTPVYAFNAYLFNGADYNQIASNSVSLLANGINTTTAQNFTTFFDATAPIGVRNAQTLTTHLANDRAFTGCTAAGIADPTQTCNGWTVSTGSLANVLTGKPYAMSTASDFSTSYLDDTVGLTCGDQNRFVYCVWFPSAEDGIKNGDETGVDCGGSTLFYDGSPAFPCYVPKPNITCPAYPVNLTTSPGLPTGIMALPNVTVSSIIRYKVSFAYAAPVTGEAQNGDLVSVLHSPLTVRATVTDGKNQQASCNFTVKVLDIESPRITCPNNVNSFTDKGVGYATHVTWITPTGGDISDNVGVVSVYPIPQSTTHYPVGSNNVTLFAADAAGNVGNCTFQVIVADIEPPTVVYCPASFNHPTDVGKNYATLNYPDPIVTDNVGLVVSNGTLVQGFLRGTRIYVNTATGLFVIPMHFQYADAAGNTNDCAFVITVIDNEKPNVACPADVYTVTDPGVSTRVVELQTGVVTDNVNLTRAVTAPQFAVGTSAVKLTATDERGNVNSCRYLVNVIDAEPPTITCPVDQTVQLASGVYMDQVFWPTPSMFDNVGITGVSSNYKSGDIFPITQNVVIRYNVSDAAGNQNFCTFQLSVLGSINTPQPASGYADPSIQCPSDVIRVAEYASNPPSAVVYWTAPGVVNSKYVLAVSGNALTLNNTLFTEGTHLLTYSLSDFSNFSTSCSFRVTVTQLTYAPTYPPARLQVSLNTITTNVLQLQTTLLTDVSSALSIDIRRVSVVSVVAGYSSTDVVLEFVPTPSTFYLVNPAAATPTSRRLLATSTASSTIESSQLLLNFYQQLNNASSVLLTGPAGTYLLPATFVNCSSTVTPTTVTRALHCPAPNGTVTQYQTVLSCPLGCTRNDLCFANSAGSACPSTSSTPWYREPWFCVLMTCIGWIVVLMVLWCCSIIGVVDRQDALASKHAAPNPASLSVPWPETRLTQFRPIGERFDNRGNFRQSEYVSDVELH